MQDEGLCWGILYSVVAWNTLCNLHIIDANASENLEQITKTKQKFIIYVPV